STKELRKKAAVLGMLSGGGFSAEERCAAETCWLDGRRGADFGGGWPGPVRRGAAAEPAAAALREALERSKAAARAIAGEAAVAAAAAALPVTTLAEWCPNPEASDEDRWGGRFGKPCGHNEVVMHRLRPFFPLEVLNTRLCSRAAPAPGNAGHDGCLEFFKLACRTGGYAATIWDMDAFHFVDRRGICAPPLDKRRLLAALPLPRLRFLVSNLRRFTVACGGQRPPRALLCGGAERPGGGGRRPVSFDSLGVRLSAVVLSFVLSGDLAVWAVGAGANDGSGNNSFGGSG
ncbi:unnamed protein product, partial [Phaeothamnion confervicola]